MKPSLLAVRIKQIPSDIRDTLSGPPVKYWKWFILLIIILFLGTLAADVYIFRLMNSSAFGEIPSDVSPQFLMVERGALVKISEMIDLKKQFFEKALLAPGVKDPSL